jgi:pimeloyl-ACP methyl ester carboxylesterase
MLECSMRLASAGHGVQYGVTAIVLTFLVALLSACASPAQKYGRHAQALGFRALVLDGKGFRHIAYAAPGNPPSGPLRVYIEHDGSPWIRRQHVSDDPTPRTHLVLELMARDPGHRLFLGRPCYFEARKDPACTPLIWTHQRYSPDVIDSMVAALRGYLTANRLESAALTGYSGGGTVAWLMAERMPEVVSVITIGANLDVARWTSVHGYSELVGSLDPARRPPLRATVCQRHYVGKHDRNVSPDLVRAFATHHPGAEVIEIPGYDHVCCWVERWPELRDCDNELESPSG